MIELSVVIPVHESLTTIKEFLPGITQAVSGFVPVQFIVVDSKYDATTESYCKSLKVDYCHAIKARRSVQMNKGASVAEAETLFFLHIDSILPRNFDSIILQAVSDGAEAGCFQMAFFPTTKFLNFFAYFTRFHWRVSRGGDQGLFVFKPVFEEIGRYREDWGIMEDVQICYVLEKRKTFSILKGPIKTSSRKYQRYGQWKLQLLFSLITTLFWLGVPVSKLTSFYRFFLSEK